MDAEDNLRSLSRIELIILFWKCQGYTYLRMSSPAGERKVPYGPDNIQKYMSQIYRKFDIPKELHHSVKKKILDEEYCPILLKFFPTVEKLEEGYQDFRAEPTERIKEIDGTIDAEMLAIVLYDQKMEEAEDEPPSQIVPFEPFQIAPLPLPIEPRRTPWILLAIFTILVIALGFFAYQFFAGQPDVVVVRETVEVRVTVPGTIAQLTEEPIAEIMSTLEPTPDAQASVAAFAAQITAQAEQARLVDEAVAATQNAEELRQIESLTPTSTTAPQNGPTLPPTLSATFRATPIPGPQAIPPGNWSVRTSSVDDTGLIYVNGRLVAAAAAGSPVSDSGWVGINDYLLPGKNIVAVASPNNYGPRSWSFYVRRDGVAVWGNEQPRGGGPVNVLSYVQQLVIKADGSIELIPPNLSAQNLFPGNWYVRARDMNDVGGILVNGLPVAATYLDYSAGWIDITGFLHSDQGNSLNFSAWNFDGEYAWDFAVKKDADIVWSINNSGSGQTGLVVSEDIVITTDGQISP